MGAHEKKLTEMEKAFKEELWLRFTGNKKYDLKGIVSSMSTGN